MTLIMIVERKMTPIPSGITVMDSYGSEAVVKDGVLKASGTAMLLSGDAETFKNWLRPFDGVWLSDNPSTGIWKVQHIKD
jgi:tagatose-1,6-bisphosphate aldolase